LLRFPYGVSFNCYFFIYITFIAINDPLADDYLSPDEALALSIIIVDDILTNFIFNLGYIYNDILMTLTLPVTATSFWIKMGTYWGDFFIRFFYRKSFLANF
jgi:hypothetical protein